MAKEYRVLGQAAPAANAETVLCTVAEGKQVVTSRLTVCNRSATDPARIRIAIIPSNIATENMHYIEYDTLIPPGGKSKEFIKGITVKAGSLVRIQSNTANVSFTLFGVES